MLHTAIIIMLYSSTTELYHQLGSGLDPVQPTHQQLFTTGANEESRASAMSAYLMKEAAITGCRLQLGALIGNVLHQHQEDEKNEKRGGRKGRETRERNPEKGKRGGGRGRTDTSLLTCTV